MLKKTTRVLDVCFGRVVLGGVGRPEADLPRAGGPWPVDIPIDGEISGDNDMLSASQP